MSGWRALTPAAVADGLADLVDRREGVVRVCVDGPPCAEPEQLAEAVTARLRDRGRDAAHVRADGFWHDRSLRFEFGREEPDSYLTWLDAGALRREVLDAAGTGSYLPSLRDPRSDRSTRAVPVELADDGVIVVSGDLLLGLGLPFDLAVHLSMSAAARGRRTPAELAWTLPAYVEYDDTVDPATLADVVVRCDDPRHPAARGLGQ